MSERRSTRRVSTRGCTVQSGEEVHTTPIAAAWKIADSKNRNHGSGRETKTSDQKGAGDEESGRGVSRRGKTKSHRFRARTLCHGSSSTSRLGCRLPG